MKFNLKDHRDTILERLVIAGFQKATKEESKIIMDAQEVKGGGYSVYDVTMQINGVEVDPESFVKRWQDGVSESITDLAQELVDDKFKEKFEELDETLDTVRGKLKEQFQIDPEED